MLELSLINDSLQKDVLAKEREIRKLTKDLQQYEQTMARMRDEMNPDVPKKDAEVMAGMCCTGPECGDLVPVKDIGELLREETSKYREKIQTMEISLKVMPFESSRVKMRAVHKINLGLIEELSTLRRLCVAVDVERRDARLKLDLEGQIVKQMVRQLRQAKAQLQQKGIENPTAKSRPDFVSGDHDFGHPTSSRASMPIACVRQPRARRRDVPPPMDREALDSSGDFRPPFDSGDGDDCLCVATSTPDGTQELPNETEISIIPIQPQPSISLSDEELEEALKVLSAECHKVPDVDNVHEQNTLKLDTPDRSRSSQGRSSPRDTREKSNTSQSTKNRSQDLAERNESPRKPSKTPEQTPRKESISIVSEQNQSIRQHDCVIECENLVSDECSSANDHLIQPPQQSQSPRISKDATSEDRYSPRRVKLEPSQSPEKPIIKESKTPVLERDRSITDRSVRPTVKRNLKFSESDEKSSSEQCECASTSDENQMEHASPETSKIHKNQTENLELKQSFRKQSKIPVPERIRNGNVNLVSECCQTLSPGENTPKYVPKCMRLEHFPRKYSLPEIYEESSEKTSTNEESNPTLPTPSESDKKSSSEQNQSLTGSSEAKPTFLRLNLYEYPIKDSISSENEAISNKSCQYDCSCDDTNSNSTEALPKTSDQSTSSDANQRWLALPESIKKSLEALRQTFLGKSEDHTSIRGPTSTSTTPDCDCTDNNTGEPTWKSQSSKRSSSPTPDHDTTDNTRETTSNSQSRERSSSLLKTISSYSSEGISSRKKSVTLQLPEKICDYCDAIASEEDDEGYSKDSEAQGPEMIDRSHGAPTVITEDGSELTSNTRSCTNRVSLTIENETSSDDKCGILSVKLLKEESTQDSGGGSSCAGACDQYYHDKLMATLQILENKEETIRVQSSSLGVAEGRIAEMTRRANSMRQELDHKARELNKLRQFADSYKADKNDVAIVAEIQDAETQKLIVETLEDNLSVIEELYRECFYETVKQEDLIDLLRKSYLDVRLMERDKSDKIARLQNVILTQKRSLEQCQDVVMEVESLKSEISCFLSTSNNDSGMWERGSECPDVGEELGDILEQLRLLQTMLTDDCTCCFNGRNKSLNEKNAALEAELEQLRHRNTELDAVLKQLLDQNFEERLKDKERECQEIRKKLVDVETTFKERSESCETLKRQLLQAQVLVNDKSAELVEVQRARAQQDATIRQLQLALETSERNVQEGLKKLSEVTRLRSEQVLESQATISDLERRLQRAVQKCRQLERNCSEKEQLTCELQSSLQEAQARGASLCAESRRVTARVRGWMRHKRAVVSEQQETIKRQEAMLRELQSSVGTRQSTSDRTSQSETEPCCSNSMPRNYPASDTSYSRSRLQPMCRSETDRFPRCGSLASCVEREKETASCSKCVSNRQQSRDRMSGSEMPSLQAPAPPRRQNRPCDDTNCPWSRAPRYDPDVRWSTTVRPRFLRRSPTDDILERVEHLHAALAAGQRRWGRAGRR